MPKITGGFIYSKRSHATWRHWAVAISFLFCPLLLFMRWTFLQRGQSDGRSDFAAVDTYAVVQIAIIGAIAVSLMLARRSKVLLMKLSGTSVGFLMLFYAFCGLSALWSPLKAYSLYRAIEVIAVCFTVFAALDCLNNFERAERLALGISTVGLAFGFIGTGRLTNWQDLSSNPASMTAAMTLCYCLGELSRATGSRKRMLLVCFFASTAALCVGTSSSANVATLCGLLVMGIVREGKIRPLLILVFAVVTLLVLTGYISWIEDASLAVLFPGKTWETVQSGHGRVALWERCWPAIMKRPLLGHGFASAPRVTLGEISAHNSFMDILLATGIIGLAFFGLSAVVLLCELRQIARRTTGYVGCCCVFASAIVGCMGTSFLGNDIHMPMISFVSFAGLYALYVLPRRHPRCQA